MDEIRTTDRTAFDNMVAQGVEPWEAGVTYEWRCARCDTATYTGRAGGLLNDGECGEACAPEDVHVHAMLAGDRAFMGTVAQLVGGAPYWQASPSPH